jgi:hypothetical protein
MAHWSAPYVVILVIEIIGFGAGAWFLLRHARGGG